MNVLRFIMLATIALILGSLVGMHTSWWYAPVATALVYTLLDLMFSAPSEDTP